VDEPQSLDGELFAAIIVEMIRAGLIPLAIMERVRENFEYQGDTARHAGSEDRAATLSRMALEIEIAASGSTLREWHDQRVADQDRRRDAYLSRRPDGGNEQA
jgi:hypothetical protein